MTTETTTTGAPAKSGLAAYKPAVIMLIAAVVVGAVVGLVTRDSKTGVYAAFGTAVLVGIVLGKLFGSAVLGGLSLKQRRRVVKAVQAGQPAPERELAAPLVEHAKAVVDAPRMSWSYRVRFAAFAVIGVVMAIFGVIGGSIGLITVGGTLALLILAGKLVSDWTRQRRQERATRSRDATVEQWGPVEVTQ
ncbi:MAG: hypothetical protein ABW224_15830 [Kibdelosporangium sp.]